MDPEKGLGKDKGESGPIEARDMTSREGSLEKEKSPRRRSCQSRASNASDDSDPLSPLELALSPGQETFEEVARIQTTTSIGSSASRPPDFEVVFDEDDPENPRNWPSWYRGLIVFSISFTSWVVVFYSTSYSAAIPGLVEEFGVSTTVATLGITTYLLGLAAGSLLVAPVSELYGRRPVYIGCMICFTILIIPCCVATSLTEIIVVRFFGAMFGACMVTNSAGTVVDISTEQTRLLTSAMILSLWSIAPLNGPVTGPVIGGFVYQYLGWRWDNWLVLILAGVGTATMLFPKETYAPMILKAKTARLRKETDDERWWCRYDVKLSTAALVKVSMLRPFALSFTEPILWFFNVWISLIYGILYLCFVAYPIVFSQHRGWSPGISGLAFVGIGVGSMIAILGEPFWRKIINSHPKDPLTGRVPPEATARVMIIGSILVPVGQLVFSWTCLPGTIHWAVPIAFGIPFGCGNALSFIYGSNYLAGAYGIYAASALAGNAVTRSIFGATLPLAGPSMYSTLSPQWAGTLLGLLEAAMIPIPLVFYRYGERIRAKSPIIRQMREDQEKNELRAEKAQRRKARRAENAGKSTSVKVGGKTGAEDLEKGVAGPSAADAPPAAKDETTV
ncbi:polyamine transporter 3 [Annulohypoxylon maeteangense]|uniref:polyamine transporter 3 n=1 Tax=Annulohypoxylon maeteangense TaxID=1927788 RepID=UPI002007263D|nr:polyamine transporter 3 [Annulohypoxylon maeteangense]KAI0886655.1 polyamine transporter 3 [Annulohypoxylon maeteangense]